jgi:integrase
MASIRKLSNGTFQATISCGRDAQNRQIRRFVTRSTEKECKSAARKIEQDYVDGKLSNYSNMKFSAWADKFIEIKRPPELSPTTYRFYKGCINTHFIPYFNRMKLCQITDIHIREYLAVKRKEVYGKHKKHYSEATIKKHYAILSNMLGMALKHNNPCLNVDAPSDDSEPRYVPTTEEFDRLLNAVDGLWDELPILLAAWCGMRQGEIFGLKVNDVLGDKIRVDENRALAEVEEVEKGGNKYEYIDKDPKSENGNRIIAVPEYIMALVHERIKSLNLKDNDRLFNMRPDSYGKRFSDIIMYHNLMLTDKPTGRQASFNNDSLPKTLHIQDAPIPEFTFHALRHYHATVLYEQHYPDLYAANRLGHDINVLKKIYQRLRLKQKDTFDDKISETFKKPN